MSDIPINHHVFSFMYLVYNNSVSVDERAKARNVLKDNGVSFLEMSARAVSSILCDDDKDTMRKLYRRSYDRRTDVRAKRLEYYSRPEVREKRRKYNLDPKNIERKKRNAKKRAELLRSIRNSQPELYAKFMLADGDETDPVPESPSS